MSSRISPQRNENAVQRERNKPSAADDANFRELVLKKSAPIRETCPEPVEGFVAKDALTLCSLVALSGEE